MLCLKLSRIGKKKQPFFRLIILEKTKDPFGDYLELLGNYNPKTKEINLKKERIIYWLSRGAQTTATVHNLLVKEGVIEGKKRKAIKMTKKRLAKIKKEEKSESPEKKEEKIKDSESLNEKVVKAADLQDKNNKENKKDNLEEKTDSQALDKER